MECVDCGGNAIVEGLGEGKYRATCQKCGEAHIFDRSGRRMLTDDAPPPRQAKELLTS